jgi:hypothetical protein
MTSNYLTIKNAGNVGIGTSSPKSYGALTVSGQTIGLSNIAVDINQAFKLNNYYSSGAGSDKTISTGYAAQIGLDNSVGALTFSNSSNSASADGNITTTERMRITSAGSVLIGNATGDGYRLQIVGSNQATSTFGQTYAGVAAYSQWINSSGSFVMGLDGGAGTTERLRVTSGGSVVTQGIIIPQNYINLTDVISQTDSVDQWPIISFSGANGAAGFTKPAGSYDWGVIKGGTSRGYYGRVIGAFHGASAIDQGFVTSGWTMQFVVNGSNGNAFLRGTLTQGSDARIKANVSNLNYGLAEVMQLRPISYNKKIFDKDNDGNILSESVDTENKYIGFIAQEVKKIIPEVVNGNENSKNPELGLSIEYQNMVSLLTKAIQELKAEIDILKQQ